MYKTLEQELKQIENRAITEGAIELMEETQRLLIDAKNLRFFELMERISEVREMYHNTLN